MEDRQKVMAQWVCDAINAHAIPRIGIPAAVVHENEGDSRGACVEVRIMGEDWTLFLERDA